MSDLNPMLVLQKQQNKLLQRDVQNKAMFTVRSGGSLDISLLLFHSTSLFSISLVSKPPPALFLHCLFLSTTLRPHSNQNNHTEIFLSGILSTQNILAAARDVQNSLAWYSSLLHACFPILVL